MHHSTIKAILMLTSTAVLPSQTAISVDGPLGKTTLFTSTVIKSFLMAILAAHHSTMKVIWMLTKTIMLMTAVMVAITQVVVRHRPVTSVIYVTMYILVMKITMATAPHPHVMWYWTPMKIGKNTVTMIQITVPNHQEMVDQVAVRGTAMLL
jgi:hypothetical protein